MEERKLFKEIFKKINENFENERLASEGWNEPLPVLSLPSVTCDSDTSRTFVMPLNELQRPLKFRKKALSLVDNSIFFEAKQFNDCSLESWKKDVSQVFMKRRTGGVNLVESVRRKSSDLGVGTGKKCDGWRGKRFSQIFE